MFGKRFFVIVVMLLGALALAACGAPDVEPGSAPGEAPTGTPESEQVAEEALPPARAALADFLGVDEDAIELEKVEDAEWSDSCLGLGGPAESCLAEITPGFAITFNVEGESYIVRTDLQGNAVRVEAAAEQAPDAALAARERIAAETGVPVEEIEIVSWSPEEWSDSCLGLGGPDESCAAVITPGYLVVLRAGDQVFNVRTDESGESIRFQETADPETEYPVSVVNARQELADELGATLDAVEVVSFERAEWSDSCLGLGGPAESCLAVITPGWRVMLSFDGAVYEVRTDELGEAVRIAGPGTDSPEGKPPDPELGDAVLFYERSGGIAGEIVTVRVYADGAVERTVGPNAPSDAVEAYSVEPAAVEQLLADLEEAGYFELERDYVPADTCCDRILHLISIRTDGEVQTVEALGGTETTPEAVWESIAIIESFVEEARGQ